jgi:aldehyde:ferredoxin oxidoreductase
MAAENGIGGYVGKILHVDLTNERISEEVLDRETLRKYVGGTALAPNISAKKCLRTSNGRILRTVSYFLPAL